MVKNNKLFYGWVVVAAFIVISTTLAGIGTSFGVFFKSIESGFNITRTATSTVLSAYTISHMLTYSLGGWALDRYGPKIIMLLSGLFTGLGLLLTSQANSLWQLYITYGLLFAAGSGPVLVVLMSTVSRWFDKKRGLAMGIAGSGVGMGTIVIAPFSAYLITNLDWRMAYLVLAVLALIIVVPISMVLRKDPYEIGLLPDGVKPDAADRWREIPKTEGSTQLPEVTIPHVIRTRSFLSIALAGMLGSLNRVLVLTHTVPYAMDSGLSAVEAASIISVIGAASIIGRILIGMLSDRIGMKTTTVMSSLLMTLSMVWIIWAHELWSLYLFAILFGIAWGGSAPGFVGLIGNTFGVSRIGSILGLLEIGFGIGGAIGPALGGFVFDASNSYSLAFLLGAVFIFIRALLLASIRRETSTAILFSG